MNSKNNQLIKFIEKIVLVSIFCLIVFNAILRWYPFPVGRSQNELNTLQDNILGIIVNGVGYVVLCLLSLVLTRKSKLNLHGVLIYTYSIYIFTQTIFRANSFEELQRSVLLICMLLSAERLGKWFGNSYEIVFNFLKMIFLASASTIFIGLSIAFLIPGSVNFGPISVGSENFVNRYRAEFFFLHWPAYFTFSAALVVYLNSVKKSFLERIATLSTLFLSFALSILTATRQVNFPLIFILISVILSRSIKYFILVVAISVAYVLVDSSQVTVISERLRINSGDVAVDPSNGRAELNMVNLETFYSSPIFGQGATKARENIKDSGSVAKSEHGYTIHLASFGFFSVLFFLYVLSSVLYSIYTFMSYRNVLPDNEKSQLLVIICLNFCVSILGFVGTFGSTAIFYDWMSVFWISFTFNYCFSIKSIREPKKKSTAFLKSKVILG
jgi:hypothetical protein